MSARSWIAFVALLATQPAAGQQPTPPSRATVEQKASFVKRLLDDSPAMQRIGASGNDEARRFVAAALDHHRRAIDHIVGGQLDSADQSLNEAMWSVGKARQLVPDVADRTIADRVRYAQLLAVVESLRGAYERHLARLRGPAVVARDAELERVDALLEDARSLANAEALPAANKALANAEQGLLAGVNRVLGASTLRYAEQFETLAEEYAFELDRNTSYGDLVPLAVAEYRPSAAAGREIGRLVERNRLLREQAQALAAKKDHRSAVRTLRSGTVLLQRAIAETGLVVPTQITAEGRP